MTDVAHFVKDRSIVLVGMMGVGKSAVGRKLAAQLALPFFDTDAEIEAAAGLTVAEIFEQQGEPVFRDSERKTIARLLSGEPCVLSTGGGAFMNETTRAVIAEKAVSIWLKGDVELLLARVAHRNDRPLLRGGDPRERITRLLAEREPVYAKADIAVTTDDRPVHETAARVLKSLNEYVQRQTL